MSTRSTPQRPSCLLAPQRSSFRNSLGSSATVKPLAAKAAWKLPSQGNQHDGPGSSCAWMLPVFTIPRWSGPNLKRAMKGTGCRKNTQTQNIQTSSILLSFVLQQPQPNRSFGWLRSPAVATPISRACLSLEDFFVANP